MTKLVEYLRSSAAGDLVSYETQSAAARKFALSFRQVEEAIFGAGLFPARYQRNRQTITTEMQRRLFWSTVAVVGCGGLGGYLIEELARLGVGGLIAVDGDAFEEHNLNRQVLSTVATLGQSKVDAAAARVAAVNPAVSLRAVARPLDRSNAGEILSGCTVVADALDSIPARLDLAAACETLGIPLVHGTIAGWYGQVATQFPGDQTLQAIYRLSRQDRGVEERLGNPSFTPAVVASLQAAEVCKILTGLGTPLRGRMLSINLLDMEIEEVRLA